MAGALIALDPTMATAVCGRGGLVIQNAQIPRRISFHPMVPRIITHTTIPAVRSPAASMAAGITAADLTAVEVITDLDMNRLPDQIAQIAGQRFASIELTRVVLSRRPGPVLGSSDILTQRK